MRENVEKPHLRVRRVQSMSHLIFEVENCAVRIKARAIFEHSSHEQNTGRVLCDIV